ncbi:2Fe-2S iron-sulfur cluster binding domain-containing protein [Nocardia arizonensis]|uniref:2Fe-2S iron-sulfur cluster binding domain-containing protein n=1 Tax=Nocardia arizonensis TaxID=1141647 RepID=UPI000B075982|nr:2Fe-2S iron-sulfur cluster binding domain-containing protein [Nocardia arizonensis]
MRWRRRRRPPPARRPDRPLILELRASGVELVVPPRFTALEALERNGIDVPSMCRAGICGTCEIEPLAVEFAPGVRPAAPDERIAPVRLCVTVRGTIARMALDL